MKRFILVWALLLVMCLSGSVWAAGTVTQSDAVILESTGLVSIVFTCVGDAANGSIPATALTNENFATVRGLWFFGALVDPGGTAPDAADLTVTMSGLDLLGGKGVNLIHATATQEVIAYSTFMTMYRYWPVTHNVTIAVANQATANATYTIELLFAR